jgi:hypothetical protein
VSIVICKSSSDIPHFGKTCSRYSIETGQVIDPPQLKQIEFPETADESSRSRHLPQQCGDRDASAHCGQLIRTFWQAQYKQLKHLKVK